MVESGRHLTVPLGDENLLPRRKLRDLRLLHLKKELVRAHRSLADLSPRQYRPAHSLRAGGQ